MNNKQTIKIICKDCGEEFDFTPGEQAFYLEKQLANPIRCKDCREARKAKYATKATYDQFVKNTVKFED